MTSARTPFPIYLDYHATTPVDPRVAAIVLQTMTTDFGNANSAEHVYGDVAAGLWMTRAGTWRHWWALTRRW